MQLNAMRHIYAVLVYRVELGTVDHKYAIFIPVCHAFPAHFACHKSPRNDGLVHNCKALLPGLEPGLAQVKSDSFPVHWNGHGQALDLAKTPGRIGLQLKMNSKNSLVHFQETASDRRMT